LRLSLTQSRLAEMLGVSTNTVARWERGERRIRNPVLVRQALERLENHAPARGPAIAAAPQGRRHNLPASLTSFIGRHDSIDQLRQTLDRTRLVTLIGVGGVGKTRLAIELATEVLPTFRDGVWLIDLVPLTAADQIPYAVGLVLGMRENPRRFPIDHLAGYLQSRQLLLILDNCEHLIAGCAALAEELLRICPALHILATSREPLRAAGEVVWRVLPLKVPVEATTRTRRPSAHQSEAEQLLIERATASRSDFQITSANAAALAGACRWLEGIPLALELAAAQLVFLTPQQLFQRLHDHTGISFSGTRTAPARQQTLESTFEWSYRLLPAAEQRLFDALAVFSGGWQLDAAEQVCGDGEPNVVERLGQLVAKSLVAAEERDGDMRFHLLEPVRAYALQHLQRKGQLTTLRPRHLAYYVALAEQADRQFWGAQHTQWFRRFDSELGNVRAALEWSLSGDEHRAELGLGLASALWRYWDLRGYLSEAQGWLVRLLDAARSASAFRARGLAVAGYFAAMRGLPESLSLCESGMALARSLDPGPHVLDPLMLYALVTHFSGKPEDAAPLWAEAMALGKQYGSAVHFGASTYWHGEHAWTFGDYQKAEAWYDESYAIARKIGSSWSEAHSLEALGRVSLKRGALDRAEQLLRRSLELRRDLEDARSLPWSLEVLGWIAADRGQTPRAACLLAAAEALNELVGGSLAMTWQADHEHAMNVVRLGGSASASAWETGKSMSLNEAVEFALDGARDSRVASPHVASLSPRERQVVALITRGLSNRQIAEQLVVTKYTVDRHVTNIRSKLGLSTRTQIVAWAYEHDSVRLTIPTV
jgi:predicted ATPase/DNA-binding CsgD family transcriptional regulator